ncbi:hypothetical protein OKW76_06955 [Sphingomonas sp. S1-29]|uniref:hypothetical protein n=1 Tax=Sphingomonas sp. S1-29 TaxID=2991074 RepID=UPI00223ED371|nr:hypothetical protein [Sphingomonas sp. S1-29]UZK70753.1 hypothetical protein OKW76_06955 [Sphingomonas sp. S1-29]
MDFFDRIGRGAKATLGMPAPVFQPNTIFHVPSDQDTEGYAGRETLGGMAQAETLGQPQQAPMADNPFGVDPGDSFWEPNPAPVEQAPQQAPMAYSPPAQQQQPMAQQPPMPSQQPMPQQGGAAAAGGVMGSGDQTMQAQTAGQVDRAKIIQAQLVQMLNSGVSDGEIRTWVAQQGVQLGGLDENLARRRDNPNAQIQVVSQLQGEKIPVEPLPEISREMAALRGGVDTFSWGSDDELYGAGKAVDYLFGQAPGDSFSDAYARGKAERTTEKTAAIQQHPGYYIGGQVAGGLATLPLGGALPNMLRGGGIVRGIGTGISSGAVYGFNSDEGGVTDRLDGAAIGGAFGGVTGGIFSGAGAGVRRLTRNGRAEEVSDAAARVNNSLGTNIQPSIAHFGRTGNGAGESIRGRMAMGLRNTLPGLATLDGNLTRFGDDVTDGVQTLATRTGAVSDNIVDAGARQLQQRPGTIAGYRETSRGIADGLYRQADQLGGGTLISPNRTVASLDTMIGNLSRSPGTETARTALQGLRDEVASQQWTAAGLRDMRTRYGRQLNAVDGVTRGEANQMWASLSRDITDGLHNAGRSDAARAYRQADRFYARRSQSMRIVENLIGKRETGFNSPQQVANKLTQMARTDADELQTVLRQLPRAEAADVRGSVLRQLGVAPASKQGDTPTFSINTFATEWNKMGPRARSVMFDQRTISDLDDLARLATAAKSIPSNSSNSYVAGAIANTVQGAAALNIFYNRDNLTSSTGVASIIGGIMTIGASAILGNRGMLRGLVNFGRTGNAADWERALTRGIRNAKDNPTWQMELTGIRDWIAGTNFPAPPVSADTADAAPTATGSIFDDQEPATPTGGSIFNGEDTAIDDPSSMINPFGEDDDENAPATGEGMTAKELVEEGLGDEPLY